VQRQRWLMTTTSSGMGAARYSVGVEQSPVWDFWVPSPEDFRWHFFPFMDIFFGFSYL
jgi:hypothetical protein